MGCWLLLEWRPEATTGWRALECLGHDLVEVPVTLGSFGFTSARRQVHVHEAGRNVAYSEARSHSAFVGHHAAKARLDPIAADLPDEGSKLLAHIHEHAQSRQAEAADLHKLARVAGDGALHALLQCGQSLGVTVLQAEDLGRLQLDELLHTHNNDVSGSPHLEPPRGVVRINNLATVQIPRAHADLQRPHAATGHRSCNWQGAQVFDRNLVTVAANAIAAVEGADAGGLAKVTYGAPSAREPREIRQSLLNSGFQLRGLNRDSVEHELLILMVRRQSSRGMM
mmetsp:Transcript_159781/g.387978  ORF Transcript_159781/g.387978 Transcript_159781/m.387978 type:complete len:283 (+) Transcript_159781:533-1381(+)